MYHTTPYDQQLAHKLLGPFTGTALHPNHLTTLTLMLGICSALLFSFATSTLAWLAALLFMLAVFSDHLDGELARMDNKISVFGHDYDYLVGGLNYTLLFASIGYGLFSITGHTALLVLGLAAGLSNPLILYLRMHMEKDFGADVVKHPAFGGFELEDFIYLIGPLTWIFGILVFFLPFALGTLGYLGWTLYKFKKGPE
ncbi:MAG: CDP-alcohol phosphatidyltransferase family protein [Thiotrichales bacterium]|nr:CDP-alcohol phosphatidyltransferase family protein [Thiotrichales bacterium]